LEGVRYVEEMAAHLSVPRRVLMMVPAGKAVDHVIERLVHVLEEDDIIIDGGNSHSFDSTRRMHSLEAKGFHFVGMGVSGGEEGALHGPALMPGGSPKAWPHVEPILVAMAARAGDGSPCCDWIGREGAGHFVKMVHNGIEYADMQLICEAYFLMKEALGLSAGELAEVFAAWNNGPLSSYLIEITAKIFRKVDAMTGQPMIDVILDTAGQKGTGKWSSQVALDLGVPVPSIAEAVFARCASAMKEERSAAAGVLEGPTASFDGDREAFIHDIHDALYGSKICAYAQGFALMKGNSDDQHWDLDLARIAGIWRAGCIIRADCLKHIMEAFSAAPRPVNLLVAPYFTEALHGVQAAWRRAVMEAARLGIPTPAISSALAYYDMYRRERLPANLLQAQRDFFGAHTYERVDRARGEFFHTDWE
ncbi:MAG: NADP-dependent phosphogluconate dehydrogenase, partial [Anaerolineae bacterium]